MAEYLTTAEDRILAILNDTNQRFQFEHQNIGEVDAFSGGIFETGFNLYFFNTPVYVSLQDNHGAGEFVRQNSTIIENAAAEFGANSDLVKAVIYTELSRGWYDFINPLGSSSILPGNINPDIWGDLIAGANFNNTNDNIRVTAKLISEIAERLDDPHPEDIYSLYNSMSHDRTYENAQTKSTPYFLKKVLEGKAWEHDEWSLPNKEELPAITDNHCFASGTKILLWSGEEKPIQDVLVGDTVLAFDRAGSPVPRTVVRLFRNTTQEWIELKFEDGRKPLIVTPGHAFFDPITESYVHIEDLMRRGGGHVVLADSDGRKIGAVGRQILYSEKTAAQFEEVSGDLYITNGSTALKSSDSGWVTYNFEVETDHNYVAGRIRVHNDSTAVINAAGSVAAALGSQLGRMLTSDEDQFTQVLAGTALGTVTRNLAEVIVDTGYHVFNGQYDFATSLSQGVDQLSDVNIDFTSAAIGTVSSMLLAELGESLGLEGFGADLFNVSTGTYAGSVLNLVAERALDPSHTGALLTGADFTNALSVLPTAVGTFFGSALAQEILPADSLQGQIGGSLGSIAGSALGISYIGTLGSTLGFLGNFVLPGIGAFFGTLIGTFLGDLFGSDPDDPYATIDLFTDAGISIDLGGQLQVISQYKSVDGFPHEATVAWAEASHEISLGYLRAVGGFDIANNQVHGLEISQELINEGVLPPGANVRLLQQMRAETNGGQTSYFVNGVQVDSAEQMVDGAIAGFIQDSEVIGGDLLIKRAALNSEATDTPTLSGDMAAAEDYGRYIQNHELVNTFIAENPESTFAAGWTITLAKAQELRLAEASFSDFYGGLSGFLASLAHGGLAVQLSDVSVSAGQNPGEVTFSLSVAKDVDIPTLLSIAADGYSLIEGTNENTVELVFDNWMQNVGYSRLTQTSANGGFLEVQGETTGRDLWIGSGSSDFKVEDSGTWSVPVGSANVDSSDDVFIGADGNDYISGGEGWDWIVGGGGNDQLFGGFQADVLFGGDGNDILNGGEDVDYLEGGAGADILRGHDGDTLLEFFADTAGYSGSDAAVNINLGTGAASGGHATGDTLIHILNVVGSAFDDTLVGDANRNVLEGGAGADYLDGGADGVIDFASYFRSDRAVVASLADQSANTGDAAGDQYVNIEGLQGTAFDDTLVGDSADNALWGFGGDDLLVVGEGVDQAVGAFGFDTMSYRGLGFGITLDVGNWASSSSVVADDSGIGIEAFEGTTFGDTIRGRDNESDVLLGNAGGDSIEGRSGDDILYGDDGNDTLRGGEGADTLRGGDGNDNLFGDNGDDQLFGDLGDDTINGGLGFDVVAYDRVRSDFTYDQQTNGNVVVQTPGLGTDTLINIERIDFVDGDLIYDIASANLSFVYRIYAASFGRTPDEGGLRFWTGVADGLTSDVQGFLANQFLGSVEFQNLYGVNPTNEEYIDAMYQNVLDRLPDQGGYDFWVGAMDQGMSRQDVLIAFTNSTENIVQTAPDFDDGVWVV